MTVLNGVTTLEAAPDPLTPPGCDLRNFSFMPVEIVRLFNSEFHAIANDSEWRAGMTLWLKSFHQVPAASLPDDDVLLCRLAELGRDIDAWRSVRKVALHGWAKCSDGRLYHRVVAEKANEAWSKKLQHRERGRRGNAVRWGRDRETRGPTADRDVVAERFREDRAPDPAGILEGSQETGTERRRKTGKQDLRSLSVGDAFDAPQRDRQPRGTRLPPDWTPSAADRDYAQKLSLDPDRTAEVFQNYWHAQAGSKGRKADWRATWRTWCSRDAERAWRRAAPERRTTNADYLAALGVSPDGSPLPNSNTEEVPSS